MGPALICLKISGRPIECYHFQITSFSLDNTFNEPKMTGVRSAAKATRVNNTVYYNIQETNAGLPFPIVFLKLPIKFYRLPPPTPPPPPRTQTSALFAKLICALYIQLLFTCSTVHPSFTVVHLISTMTYFL